MQPELIRARQIKALYQRELTTLNRNPHLSDEMRQEQAERLWRQANDQIEGLRASLEAARERLNDEQRSMLEPPKRPAYLGPV